MHLVYLKELTLITILSKTKRVFTTFITICAAN